MKIRKRTKKLIFSTMLSFCLALSFVVPFSAATGSSNIVRSLYSYNFLNFSSSSFPSLNDGQIYDLSSAYWYNRGYYGTAGSPNSNTQSSYVNFNYDSNLSFLWGTQVRNQDGVSTYFYTENSFDRFQLNFDISIQFASSLDSNFITLEYSIYSSSVAPNRADYVSATPLSSDSITVSSSSSFSISFDLPFDFTYSQTFLYVYIHQISSSIPSGVNKFTLNNVSFITYNSSPSFSGNDIFSLPYTEHGTVDDSDYYVDYTLSNVTEYNQGWVQDGRGSFEDQNQNGLFFDSDIYSNYDYPSSIYGQTAFSWGTLVDGDYPSHLFYWTDKPRACVFDLKVHANITAYDEDHWNRSTNIYLAMYLSRTPLRASDMIARTGSGMYYFQQPSQSVMYTSTIKLEQLLWQSTDPYTLFNNFKSQLVSFSGVPTYISFGIIVSNSLYESNINYPSVFESGIDVTSLDFRVYNYDPSDNSYINADANIPTPTPRPENPDIGDIYDQNEQLENTLTNEGENPVFDGDHINDYFIDNANDNIDNMIRPFNGFLGTIDGCITWFQQMWKTLLQSETGFPDTFSPFYLLTPAAIVLILRSVLGR